MISSSCLPAQADGGRATDAGLASDAWKTRFAAYLGKGAVITHCTRTPRKLRTPNLEDELHGCQERALGYSQALENVESANRKLIHENKALKLRVRYLEDLLED